MSKYIIIGISVLLLASIIANKILWDKYDAKQAQYMLELQRAEQLSKDIEVQNNTILSLKLDSEKFKQEYKNLLEQKSQTVLQPIINQQVSSCKDILNIIEQGL